ncbi:hypothetical protein PENSPDRAFT_107450 [Peniophora sp. CONT]|nr:hypothetical protein PENSPDRAFT_107450 [Peniophora sp. CONT]
MPQVPSRPPPYSVECSSFPPPIEAAAGPQAWAFQRAFESAREPVRWAILTTMRCWDDAWSFKDVEVPRQRIQQAYDQAPSDLKVTLDYIITKNLPFYFLSEGDRRCYDLYLTDRVHEAETSMLSQADFLREFHSAVEPVKKAIVLTMENWVFFEERKDTKPVSKSEAAQVYASASGTLKVVISWMLATGWIICICGRQEFEQGKDSVHRSCQNLVTAHIELHAMNRLAGMY